MLSGVEIAGLMLGSLPLIISFLEEYSEGLHLLKKFRDKNYKRLIRRYVAELGTQQVFLIDVLSDLMEDTIDTELDGKTNLEALKTLEDPIIQHRLRARLQYRYEPFMNSLRALNEDVEELRERLELNESMSSPIRSGHVSRQLKKFLQIISEDVLDNLLQHAKSLTSNLESLAKNAQTAQTRRKTRNLAGALKHHRYARKYARALYTLLAQDRYWQCTQDRQHMHLLSIRLANNSTEFSPLVEAQTQKFALTFWTTRAGDGGLLGELRADEFLFEVVTIPTPESTAEGRLSMRSQSSQLAGRGRRGRSSVAFVLPEPSVMPTVPVRGTAGALGPEVADICSALLLQHRGMPMTSTNILPGCRGILRGNDHVQDHYYGLYHSRNITDSGNTLSLYEAIKSAAAVPEWEAPVESLRLRQNSLRVACSLAIGTLQYHGSWLNPFWQTKDILMIADSLPSGADRVPYMTRRVPLNRSGLQAPRDHFIQSMTLFPLGLCLVELAFCQPLEALKKPEDDDPNTLVTKFNTAKRLLPIINRDPGGRYGNVVKECLFWSGNNIQDMDDEDYQASVFEKIVRPLLEDFRSGFQVTDNVGD